VEVKNGMAPGPTFISMTSLFQGHTKYALEELLEAEDRVKIPYTSIFLSTACVE
jgi:hypothetical protein